MVSKQAVKERPIIFGPESVRAIIDGRKTMTRRVVNPQPAHWLAGHLDSGFRRMVNLYTNVWGAAAVVGNVSACRTEDTIRCPFGTRGDRLWVKEAAYIAPATHFGPNDGNLVDDQGRRRVVAWYASSDADGRRCAEEYGVKVTRAMYCPRWASRLTLEIVAVRVERLAEIACDDIRAEGIECLPEEGTLSWAQNCRERFAAAWDRLNGKKHPWESNPWVWVIEFRRVTDTEHHR